MWALVALSLPLGTFFAFFIFHPDPWAFLSEDLFVGLPLEAMGLTLMVSLLPTLVLAWVVVRMRFTASRSPPLTRQELDERLKYVTDCINSWSLTVVTDDDLDQKMKELDALEVLGDSVPPPGGSVPPKALNSLPTRDQVAQLLLSIRTLTSLVDTHEVGSEAKRISKATLLTVKEAFELFFDLSNHLADWRIQAIRIQARTVEINELPRAQDGETRFVQALDEARSNLEQLEQTPPGTYPTQAQFDIATRGLSGDDAAQAQERLIEDHRRYQQQYPQLLATAQQTVQENQQALDSYRERSAIGRIAKLKEMERTVHELKVQIERLKDKFQGKGTIPPKADDPWTVLKELLDQTEGGKGRQSRPPPDQSGVGTRRGPFGPPPPDNAQSQ